MTPRLAAPRLPLRAAAVTLLLTGLFLGLVSAAATAREDAPTVTIVEIDGPLDRPAAGYLGDALQRASDLGAEVVVVAIDTPGGLGVSGAELAERIRDGDVPVAVWVGPPGAQAAGAGAVLADAAHVLALAPGSTLGPAAPADLREGSPEGDAVTVSAASLAGDGDADAPGRVVDEATVLEEGVADIVAPGLEHVLRELHGQTVQVAGETRTLDVDPVDAHVRFDNMTLGRKILHGLADPSLAYLLLVAGALALAFEIFQPGFGVAGVSGLALFGLGLYGVVVLPVAWWALALLLVGLALLAADLAIGGLGPLSAGGAVAFTAGSIGLFAGHGFFVLPWWLVALAVVSVVVFFVPVMTMVLRAQGTQAQVGAERVVGKTGVVRSMLNPEGHVFIDGALWRARAPDAAGKVKTGTQVRVVGLNDRLTLDVELIEAPQEAARHT